MEGARKRLPPPSGQEAVKSAKLGSEGGASECVKEGGGWEEHPRCPHSPSASSRRARTDGLTDTARCLRCWGARAPGIDGQLEPRPAAPHPVPSGPMAPHEVRSPGGAG